MTERSELLIRSLRSYSHTTGANSTVGVEIVHALTDNGFVFFLTPRQTRNRCVVLHINLEQARAMTAILENRPEPGAYFWEAMGAA